MPIYVCVYIDIHTQNVYNTIIILPIVIYLVIKIWILSRPSNENG